MGRAIAELFFGSAHHACDRARPASRRSWPRLQLRAVLRSRVRSTSPTGGRGGAVADAASASVRSASSSTTPVSASPDRRPRLRDRGPGIVGQPHRLRP
jgi:hypothetical protein